MYAHEWMYSARRGGQVRGGDAAIRFSDVPRRVYGRIVLEHQRIATRLERWRQGVVREIQVGEPGAPAFDGHLERMQDRLVRGRVEARHIGVPNDFAVAQPAERHAVFDDV